MLSTYLSVFRFLLIAALIGILIFFFVTWRRRRREPRDIIQCRTGTNGSGKTFTCVLPIISAYKKYDRAYRHRRNIFRKLFGLSLDVPPRVYSSIPLFLKSTYRFERVRVRGKFPFRITRQDIYSDVLTREHLLFRDFFDRHSIPLVLYDEIGNSCNQYAFKDPNIVSANINDNFRTVETFIRLFRHVYGNSNGDLCRFYCTDQSSGNICIAIRRRLGIVDNLNDFRRFFGFLPFYKVDVRPMLMSDDQTVNVSSVSHDEDVSTEYYMGFFPYRFFRKHYDTHCYSESGNTIGITDRVSFSNWADNNYFYFAGDGSKVFDKLKTNYIPDLRMTLQERREYETRLGDLKNRYRVL